MSTGTCVRPRYLVITPEQVREGMSAGILVLLINVTCGVMIFCNSAATGGDMNLTAAATVIILLNTTVHYTTVVYGINHRVTPCVKHAQSTLQLPIHVAGAVRARRGAVLRQGGVPPTAGRQAVNEGQAPWLK